MNYEFPIINTIDDVLPAIKDKKEFIVAERDWYDVINYMVAFDDTFPEVNSTNDVLLRECRGLIFDKSGKLISRRYHKFFNINEKPETNINLITNTTEPYVLLSKLDGSMITPLFDEKNNKWHLATKMGVTTTAISANRFLSEGNYISFFKYCYRNGITPIFEYISPNNQIVVKYNKTQLILTGMRYNDVGVYFPYIIMVDIANHFNIPYVDIFNIDANVNTNIEGWIYRFDNGHMVKSKTKWYLDLHKFKDMISSEKYIVSLIVNDQFDDIMSIADEQDLKNLIRYKDDLLFHIINWSDNLYEKTINILNNSVDKSRKNFALTVQDERVKQFGFKYFDQLVSGNRPNVLEYTKTLISKTKFEIIKSEIFPNVEYRIDNNE